MRTTKLGTAAGKTCEYCGKELPVRNFSPFGCAPMMVTMPCGCDGAQEAARREEEESIRAERAEKFRAAWAKSGIPEEFIGVEADFGAVDRIDSNRSIYITGKNGRGKTYKACQYAKGYLIRHTTRQYGVMACRKSVRFVTSQQISSLLKSSWTRWDVAEEDVFMRLIGVDLLVLDDLGKEVPSEWSAGNIFRIIDERWSAHKPVIITSQFSSVTIADRMCDASPETLDALKSRLRGWCDGEVLDGPDRRVSK